MSSGPSNKLVGQVGEFLVCAEPGRRELIANPFSGNVPGFRRHRGLDRYADVAAGSSAHERACPTLAGRRGRDAGREERIARADHSLRGSGFPRRDVEEVEDLEGGFGLVVRPPDLRPDRPQAHRVQDAAQHQRGARGLAAQQLPSAACARRSTRSAAARRWPEPWPRGRRPRRAAAPAPSPSAWPNARVPLPSPMKAMKFAIRRSARSTLRRVVLSVSGRSACRRFTSTATRSST